MTEGMLENLTGGGGGSTALEIQTGGVSEPKNTSSGVTLIVNFINVSIASIHKF